MSRGLSVAQKAASESAHRVVAPLIELLFDSGTLRLAVFPWDVIDGANTYFRAAVTPGSLRESSVSVEGFSLSMSGLDQDLLTLAESEQYQGRVARILKGYVQPDSNQLIGNARMFMAGRMRNMTTSEDSNTAGITLFAEHYDAELDRPAPLRYSDNDQQHTFPGDKGCEYTAENSEKTIVWPSVEAQKYNPLPNWFYSHRFKG